MWYIIYLSDQTDRPHCNRYNIARASSNKKKVFSLSIRVVSWWYSGKTIQKKQRDGDQSVHSETGKKLVIVRWRWDEHDGSSWWVLFFFAFADDMHALVWDDDDYVVLMAMVFFSHRVTKTLFENVRIRTKVDRMHQQLMYVLLWM